jgi:nitrogen fixation NifU-like protein
MMSDRDALKDEYIEHMIHPKNYGSIKSYDAKGVGQNPYNNELVEIYLKVKDDQTIEDIKFQAIGCMSTIVVGSIFTDMIKGESLDEALDVAEEFLKKVENAPKEDRACAEMVAKAFMAAKKNYHNRLDGEKEEEYIMLISSDCVVEDEK